MIVLVGRTSGDRKFTDLLHGWPDRVAAVIRLAVTLQIAFLFGRCFADARHADTASHFCGSFLFYVDIESAECCDSCLASFADAYYGSVA